MTSDLPEMRASDADRDATAEQLRDGFAEGRLNTEEFEERLEAAYAARTRKELEPLVRDLPRRGDAPSAPAVRPEASAGRWADRFGGKPSSRSGLALMSGFARKGRWTAPRVFRAFAFWGGGEIDLRHARFEDREVKIQVTAIMGGVNITVPHDAEVSVEGIGIMGGFDHSHSGTGVPGAPRIVITGVAFWGGVGVERGRPEDESTKQLGGGDGPHGLHGGSSHGH